MEPESEMRWPSCPDFIFSQTCVSALFLHEIFSDSSLNWILLLRATVKLPITAREIYPTLCCVFLPNCSASLFKEESVAGSKMSYDRSSLAQPQTKAFPVAISLPRKLYYLVMEKPTFSLLLGLLTVSSDDALV